MDFENILDDIQSYLNIQLNTLILSLFDNHSLVLPIC